jgi:hypothetical protein
MQSVGFVVIVSIIGKRLKIDIEFQDYRSKIADASVSATCRIHSSTLNPGFNVLSKA